MSPALATLIAEGVVDLVRALSGNVTHLDVLEVIRKAERAASDAEMERKYQGQAR